MSEMGESTTASTAGATIEPTTLCIDVGGTGLKAAVVDAKGTMLTERIRVVVEYPMGPSEMIERLAASTAGLPAYARVSMGFPGVVRDGTVLTAPHFVTVAGPGTRIDPHLVEQWSGFGIAAATAERFERPTRVVNDADLQALDVMSGHGVEMVMTLGTGVGTAIVEHGLLGPHLELAHHPLRRNETYNERLGDAARQRIGNRKWAKRVARAVTVLDALVLFDVLYIGGGNSRHLHVDLGPKVKLVDPNAGILGGVRLWDQRLSTVGQVATGSLPSS